jgi:hypothetical protein
MFADPNPDCEPKYFGNHMHRKKLKTTMNQPNSELTQFPSAATHAMSSVYEKCSTRSSDIADMDPRIIRSWKQHEMESTTVLPPPGYRYPRRGAFTHSDLLRDAVIASIESSGSFDDNRNEVRKTSSLDGCNVQLFDMAQGKTPLKRSRSVSVMEEGPDSTEIAFISESIDMQSLSIRLPHLSTGSRRVSLRWAESSANSDSSATLSQGV